LKEGSHISAQREVLKIIKININVKDILRNVKPILRVFLDMISNFCRLGALSVL